MEQFKKALKDKATIRWTVLLLVAFVQATNYYFYDSFSPLKVKLEELFNFTSSDFGLFVSFYSVPNTFLLMAIFGGIILDRLGIRRTGFTFVFLMAMGAILTAYGASDYYRNGGLGYSLMSSFLSGYSPELKMMLLGRLLFGLGAETSIVVISKIIVKWFKGKELALAFGFKIGLARLGSFAAFNLSPALISQTSGITIAIWFAAILVGIGLLFFMIYMMFDLKLDKQVAQEEVSKEQFKISDIVQLFTNRSFIFVTILCLTFYSAVFPFQAYASDLFVNKFNMTPSLSGFIASILPLGTAIFTPIFGNFVDKKGKSATLMIYGSILLILVHLTLTFTMVSPYVPIFVIGIAFSLVPAAMWPAVAKIVPSQRIGSAYGAMFSIQNIGLFLVPIIAGVVLDSQNKNAYDKLNVAETKQIILNEFYHSGTYLDNKGKPISDKDLAVNYLILSDTTSDAKLIWSEKQIRHTDQSGTYNSVIGDGEILNAKINYFNLDADTFEYKVLLNEDIIAQGILGIENDFKNEFRIAKKIDSEKIKSMVTITNTNNEVVWQEAQKIKMDKKGKYSFKLGEGEIIKANISYLKWDDNYTLKVKTPLNYTLTVLVFVFVGVIALVFAFMLKWDDKKSGYGLELPSNVKGEKSE